VDRRNISNASRVVEEQEKKDEDPMGFMKQVNA
jgi:hypothetical protein